MMTMGERPPDEAAESVHRLADESADNATEDAMMTDPPHVPDENAGAVAADVEMTDMPDQFGKTAIVDEGNVAPSEVNAVPDSKNASTVASAGVAQGPETTPGASSTQDVSMQMIEDTDVAQRTSCEKEASSGAEATLEKMSSAPTTAATPTPPEIPVSTEKETPSEFLASKSGSMAGSDAAASTGPAEKPVNMQNAPPSTESVSVPVGAGTSGSEPTSPVKQAVASNPSALADTIPAEQHEQAKKASQTESRVPIDATALAQSSASTENFASAEKQASSTEAHAEKNLFEAKPTSEERNITEVASAPTENSKPEEKLELVVPAAQTDASTPGDQSAHVERPALPEKPTETIVPSVAPNQKLETGEPAELSTSPIKQKPGAPADTLDEVAVEKKSSQENPESEKRLGAEKEPEAAMSSALDNSECLVSPAQAAQATANDMSSDVEKSSSIEKSTASVEQSVASTGKLDIGTSEKSLATEKSVTAKDTPMSAAENVAVALPENAVACAEKLARVSDAVGSQKSISESAKRPLVTNTAESPKQPSNKTSSHPNTVQATSAAPTASGTPALVVPVAVPTTLSAQQNQPVGQVLTAPAPVTVSTPLQPAKAISASPAVPAANAPTVPTTEISKSPKLSHVPPGASSSAFALARPASSVPVVSTASNVAYTQKVPQIPTGASSSISASVKPVAAPAATFSEKNFGPTAAPTKAVPVAPVPKMIRTSMSGISTPMAGATTRPSTGGVPPAKRVRMSGTLDAAGSTGNAKSNGVDVSEAALHRYRQAAADTGVRLIARASASVQLSGDRKQMFLDDHARYMREIGAEFKLRTIGGSKLDLFTLYVSVLERGGVQAVISSRTFRLVAKALDLPRSCTSAAYILRSDYEKMLYYYEQKHVWGRDPVQAPSLSVVDRSSRPSAVQPSPQVLRNTPRPMSRTIPRSGQPAHVANSTPMSARPKRQAALAASNAVAAAAAAQADEMYGSPDSTPRRTRTVGIDEMSLTPTEEAIVEEEVNANAPHTVYVPGAQGERERVIGALWSTVHDDVAFALGTLNALSFDPRNTFQARQFTGLLDALYEIMHRHLEDVLGSRSFSLPTGTEQIDPAAPRVVPMPAIDVADAGHLSEGSGIGLYGNPEHDKVLRSSSLQQYGNLFNVVDSVAVDREQCAVVAVNILRNMSFSDRNAIFLSESQTILELSAEMILTMKVPANLRDGLMDMWINVSPYLNVSKGYPGHVVLTTCIKLLDLFLEGADLSRFTNCGEVLTRLAASPERNEEAFVEQFNDLLPRLVDMLGGKDRRYMNAGLSALCNCSAFDWPARSRIARVPRAMPRLVQMLSDPELAPRAALTLLNLAEAPSNRSVLLAYEKQLVEQAIKVSPAADTVASVLFDLSND